MYISDEAVLKMERTRQKYVKFLKDMGIVVVDESIGFDEILTLLGRINNDDSFYMFHSHSDGITELYNDDLYILDSSWNNVIINNPKIKKITFNNLTTINASHAISSLPNLEEVVMPKLKNSYYSLTANSSFIFSNIPKIKKMDVESIENIGSGNIASGNFYKVGNESQEFNILSLPKLASLNATYSYNVITECGEKILILSGLTGVVSCSVGTSNLNMKICDFGSPSSISSNIMSKSTQLKIFILRNNSKITDLSSSAAFSDTPFTNQVGGIIYCPSALIKTYQSATNWSNLNVEWKALEGSEFESLDWYKNYDLSKLNDL